MDESDTESERVGRYRVVARQVPEGARLRLHLDASVLLRLAPDPERPGRSRLEIAGVADEAASEAAHAVAHAMPDSFADEARSSKPTRLRVGLCVLLGASVLGASLAAVWRFLDVHEAPRPSGAPVAVPTGAEPTATAGPGQAESAAPLRPRASAPKPAPPVIRLVPSVGTPSAPPPLPSTSAPSVAPPAPGAQPAAVAPTAPRLDAPPAQLERAVPAPDERALPAAQRERAVPAPDERAVPAAQRERAVPPAPRGGASSQSSRPPAQSGLELFDDPQ